VALGHGGDEGGVEAAGEQDPERDVSHEPLHNRAAHGNRAHGHVSVSNGRLTCLPPSDPTS
jgi:hypothetical protein